MNKPISMASRTGYTDLLKMMQENLVPGVYEFTVPEDGLYDITFDVDCHTINRAERRRAAAKGDRSTVRNIRIRKVGGA